MPSSEKLSQKDFLSAFVAIVGPPNVGKSTLLNRILGTKVAIVSPKPQTTRNRVLGVYHGKSSQIIFIDTPGIHRTKTPLHRSMVASARASFAEVDIIVLMIDILRPDYSDMPLILGELKKSGKTTLLAINKIDRGVPETLLPVMDSYSKKFPFGAIIPISALTGDGVQDLLAELNARLHPGPVFFPPEMKTDQTESFLIAEIIREKIYMYVRKEVPYSCAVTVEHFGEVPGKNLLRVAAKIHVESDSQKAILIGAKGGMIRKIGQSARKEIEGIFGIHTFLDLAVRVEKNWSRDPRALRRLGY